MSRNDEQLDQLLRQTLGGKTFEQKPHYWEGAKQLIDTHRKQRNRNLIFYSVSVAIVTVVASAWIWSSSPKSTTTPSSENELAFASVNPTNPNTTEQGNPAPKPSSSVGSTASQTESSLSVEASPASTSSVTASSPQTHQSVSGNANTTQRKHKRSSSPVVSSEQQVTVADNQSTEASVSQALYTREPERISFRKAVFAPKFSNNLKSDTFSRKTFDQAYTQRTQQQLWILEAGVNSYNGLSANVHGGIRYMRFVSPSLALSLGATYAQLHQDMSRTYQDIDYTFGQQVQETNIQTQRIDYIELPVAVHYAINTKHLINLGCIPAYAIHTKDKVTYSLGETPQSGNIAYMDAINRFDLQLQAGYSFRINPTWMLSANYQFGLMDISNNNVFKSTNFDRNQGLRLTLGYKLF